MIVMKFGGTSVADATRMLAAAEIVRERLTRSPLVVVSAMAGVTDLLVRAIAVAREGSFESLEPVLADLERRHRWAVAGVIEDASRRHDLALDVDGVFEEIRERLRSVRVLGEGTSRATDALLACGEILSSRILVEAFAARGLRARAVDAREVMITDSSHGLARPDLEQVRRRCQRLLVPVLEAGEVAVVGGFIGATPDGTTTTLGRGGSDTSAAVLGAAIEAEEIQIWTDVDGMMSADPSLVPGARTLEQVSFAEAAELAIRGARVLHPASLAPAVERDIPVRVLNALRPEGRGTVILAGRPAGSRAIAAITSRDGISTVRFRSAQLRRDPRFLERIVDAFRKVGIAPFLAVTSELAATFAVEGAVAIESLRGRLEGIARVECVTGRAVVTVVGLGLADDPRVRGHVLSVIASLDPELVATGPGTMTVAAVVPEERLTESVREVHRQFIEAMEAA